MLRFVVLLKGKQEDKRIKHEKIDKKINVDEEGLAHRIILCNYD